MTQSIDTIDGIPISNEMTSGTSGSPSQPTPDHFSDWNEVMVERHDPELYDHKSGMVRWVERRKLKIALRLLDVATNHAVLSVGGGAGYEIKKVDCDKLHSLDLSKSLTRKARERLTGKAAVLRADADFLPYAPQSFDRVLCLSVLSHVLHPERVLSEMRRVTKPGGKIVVSVSNEPAIEKGLKILRLTGLTKFFLGGPDPDKAHVFSSEYHLHQFSRSRLATASKGILRERQCRRLPFTFWPAHLVALYEVE